MKKLVSIGVICFLICINVHSQDPFGTLGTTWTYEGWSEGSGYLPNWEGSCEGNELLFEVSSQIDIDGKTCGIITTNKSNDSLIVYQEDGIVYFYENSKFYKLYDFTALKGDTILTFRPSNAGKFSLKDFSSSPSFTYSSTDTIYTIIAEYDTTIVNGVALRRWKTEPLYTDELEPGPVRLYETIIENIGSLNGIIGDHDLFIGDGCYGGFVCYESDQFLLGSYFFPKCAFTSSIATLSNSNLSIFPNPAQDEVRFQLKGSKIKRIQIYDISGVEIMSSTLSRIDVSKFPSGLYFIIVSDSQGYVYSERLIKQ